MARIAKLELFHNLAMQIIFLVSIEQLDPAIIDQFTSLIALGLKAAANFTKSCWRISANGNMQILNGIEEINECSKHGLV
jgi:hypothetical protein